MTGSVEERVAYLEGKVEERSRGFGEIRELLVELNGRIGAMDLKFDSRIDSLGQKLDSRINSLDQKLDSRINSLDQKLDFRIDSLDQKVSRHFTWLVGIQVAILLSIIGALVPKQAHNQWTNGRFTAVKLEA